MAVDMLRYRRDRKGREKRSFGPIVNDAPDLLTYEISANAAHHATYRAGNNGAATRFDKSPDRSTARPDGAPAKPSGRPRCYHLRGAPEWFARLNDRDDI